MWRAWLTVIVACSGPGSAISSSDAGGDAPASDVCDPTAPPGKVSVHAAYSTILTHDRDGLVLERFVNDADPTEIIDVDVPGCGAITKLDRNRRLYLTILSVEPGDVLFGPQLVGYVPARNASVVIDMPLPDTTSYLVSAGSRCSSRSSGPELSLPWYDNCLGPDGTSTVLVVPGESTSGFTFALFENVSLADTEATPLRVTSWRTDAPLHRMRLEFLTPPDAVSCGANSLIRGGALPGGGAYVQTPAAIADLDFQFPEFGQAAVYRCSENRGQQTRTYTARVDAPMSPSITLAEGEFLPLITSASTDGDLVRPTARFSTMPDTTNEDFARITLDGLGPTEFALWVLYVPPGTRAVRVPELPADLKIDFAPDPPITANLYEASDIVTYRAARQDLERDSSGLDRIPVGSVTRTTAQYGR